MKTILYSTAFAAGLAALSLTPASAAGVMTRAPVATSPLVTDVACRTVETRKVRNGVTRIERKQVCNNDRRAYRDDRDRRHRDRRYVEDRRYDPRPGFNIRIGQ
ncbi:hypothetical protein JOD31_003132 [Methylopila capsulata]|uniref:Uncharacterized protein n=1 Tax=Methylopila capsulata TaxID=61654 RepID=A0A9W6MST6_9HYPH|nr:hypothetical protein [Methylopila capsulata]MBM7852890.1 hypothetical protein [Methylopila capsulata]GLK57100.1 hypothetical protein GCM10008170_31190 [Methylopila capsulata]